MDASNELLDVSLLGLWRKQEIAWRRYVPCSSPSLCFSGRLEDMDGFTKIERSWHSSFSQAQIHRCGNCCALVVWVRKVRYLTSRILKIHLYLPSAGGIAGFVGNPAGTSSHLPTCRTRMRSWSGICWLYLEIVMVRLQGDFAKPPEKRFNYKNCFDALFRVRSFLLCLPLCTVTTTDGDRWWSNRKYMMLTCDFILFMTDGSWWGHILVQSGCWT